MKKTFVTLTRVSTKAQGHDGNGMESQRQAVREYVDRQGGMILHQFEEVVSGTKTDKERPILKEALELCKNTGSILVVKKLDRLARNACFLLSLQESGIEFVCVDQPNVCKFTVGILALVASHERSLISERTKAGLKIAAARGKKLGGSRGKEHQVKMNKVRSERAAEFNQRTLAVIEEIKKSGVESYKGLSDCLNRRGYTTRMGSKWYPTSVRNVMVGMHGSN